MNSTDFFTIEKKQLDTQARTGIIHTTHGDIHTPMFVPVATQASLKSLTSDDANALGVELCFVNTYHAYLRPGTEVIQSFGGLHAFMHWNKPLITDSGGFQVFSLGGKKAHGVVVNGKPLSVDHQDGHGQKEFDVDGLASVDERDFSGKLVHIDDEGVTFTSHWDGSQHRFTPERSIEIQHALGADLIIAFDECAPYPSTHDYAEKAMKRTHEWAERSLACHLSHGNQGSRLYGVVQGGIFEDLRRMSARKIAGMAFDGIAIGGVSVGESKTDMHNVCEWVIPELPDAKPRHLLGVGEVDDVFAAVEAGIDTMDCVQPTRLARMGHIIHQYKTQRVNGKYSWTYDITKSMYAMKTSALAQGCECYTCANFSQAYLHHLFKVRELLAYRLATIHNIHMMITLARSLRMAIETNSLQLLKKQWEVDD